MRKTVRTIAVVTTLCSCLAIAGYSVSDVVRLKNGNELRGTIVPQNSDGSIQLELPFGTLILSSDEVMSVEKNELGFETMENALSQARETENNDRAQPAPVEETTVAGEDQKVDGDLSPEKAAKLDKLVSALNSKDVNIVHKAYDDIVAAGPEAVPYLSDALKEADSMETPYLMTALYALNRDRAFEMVAPKATHENRMVREATVILLGEMRDHRATTALTTALADKKYDVRREAAKALGKIGDSAAVPALLKATDDNDAEVRRAAAEALKVISDTRFNTSSNTE